MGKIDEMFKDNEKIIIDTLKQIRNSLYVEENFYEWKVAIDKILDLYNKEKEKNKNSVSKDEIKTLLQDVDNTKFINKHVKGMYLYNNLKCLLEE